MTAEDSRSRRDVVATATGAAILGAIWGAAFPVVATERRPTISVIGRRNAQVVLIDSTSTRTLLLSGEPDPELMDRLPAIMTVFRQRIDLLIATPGVLASQALPLRERWRIRHAVVLSGSPLLPWVTMPTTVVSDAITIGLDGSIALEIRMGHRNAWQADERKPESPLWCATLRTGAGNVVMAPGVASVAAIGPPASVLMIVPEAPPPELLAVSPVSAMAVNFDSDSIRSAPLAGTALTRIFPADIARIVIGDQWLELPEWTQVTRESGGR